MILFLSFSLRRYHKLWKITSWMEICYSFTKYLLILFCADISAKNQYWFWTIGLARHDVTDIIFRNSCHWTCSNCNVDINDFLRIVLFYTFYNNAALDEVVRAYRNDIVCPSTSLRDKLYSWNFLTDVFRKSFTAINTSHQFDCGLCSPIRS